jgi:hypothetical protein
MGVKSNAYRLLLGKPTGKRPRGRPSQRWVDNIKTDFGETEMGEGVDSIGADRERDKLRAPVISVMNLWVP